MFVPARFFAGLKHAKRTCNFSWLLSWVNYWLLQVINPLGLKNFLGGQGWIFCTPIRQNY